MEEKVLSQLVEELKLNSEKLVSRLRSTISGLMEDPRDLRCFTLYATMVNLFQTLPLMSCLLQSNHQTPNTQTHMFRILVRCEGNLLKNSNKNPSELLFLLNKTQNNVYEM